MCVSATHDPVQQVFEEKNSFVYLLKQQQLTKAKTVVTTASQCDQKKSPNVHKVAQK